jgi:cytochrome c biogenesis protein ResB
MSATWWLWASIAVLALMAVNTVFCSLDSIVRKRQNRHWLLVISPQIIHVGFMLMLAAHLLSSIGATKGAVIVREGAIINLTETSVLRIKSLKLKTSPQGYPTDWRANIEYIAGNLGAKPDYLAPNRPSFYQGFGIYLKEIRPFPVMTAIIEINREPGAPWALAGGILFTIGTIALVVQKIRREK